MGLQNFKEIEDIIGHVVDAQDVSSLFVSGLFPSIFFVQGSHHWSNIYFCPLLPAEGLPETRGAAKAFSSSLT